MRREWFLALASVLILLVLLEGATRLYYLVRGGVPPTPDESLRNEWAWAAAHLREGRAVVPGGSDYDAQLGWRPNENIDAWVRRKGWGLADGELTVPRRPRVEFVGDSFTYGLYVSDDESFAVRLGADHLRDHEIVNFGVNGYGADQMLLLYETIGRLYRPDIVVMAACSGRHAHHASSGGPSQCFIGGSLCTSFDLEYSKFRVGCTGVSVPVS
jgi:hypothetical protein